MLSPLSFFSFFLLSLSVLLFLLSFQENDWLINGANNVLSKCLLVFMHCACYLVQESGKARLFFFALIIVTTIIQQTVSLCVSPVGCSDDFYADITALGHCSSCWTVWWNSYEAGRRQGVNSHTAATAITLIIALHLANLDTFVSPCCTNSKITHTIHHRGCWCICL